jgi:transposase-like protein
MGRKRFLAQTAREKRKRVALMPAGRPSDYQVEFCKTAHELCAQGATIREVAEAFEVNESTVYRWAHGHPEFRQSLQLGRDAADDRVEESLYRRAVGYSFDSIKIMQHEGGVIVEPFVEHVPPDVAAAKFWLTNRRSKDWRDTRGIEHSGAGGAPIVIAATLREEKL